MDRITKSCVSEFLEQHEMAETDLSVDFEKLCNFSIVSHEFSGSFDVQEVCTDPGTQGIDGIAIIVNGKLVDDVDQVSDLVESNKCLEAAFVLVQAKTSPKFEASEMGHFGYAVKKFFDGDTSLFPGDAMANFMAVKDRIYDLAPNMTKGNPTCRLVYVTTGSWQDDANLLAVMRQTEKELRETNLFSEVRYEPCDAAAIQRYYRKTKEAVTATFTFDRRVTLPEIDGVQEAYFGFLPFREYRSLICNEFGVIKSVFYDNVRDFLGSNRVNKNIDATLKAGAFAQFGVLNNGVSIIAQKLQATGDKFTISDYQIVNGCQTSHVLFNNRDLAGMDDTIVPVRLIVTTDEEIRNRITQATNNQTEIKPEQLAALSDFQKDLEQYYNAIDGHGRLYYERRSNQYSSDNSVTKTKVISIRFQIKAFAAMFLDSPHLVSGYYGTVASRLGDRIFTKGQSYCPYYTSGLAYYRLETLFRTGQVDSSFKKARYHLLTILRRLAANGPLPPLASKKIDAYCQQIIDALNEESRCVSLFSAAVEVLTKSGIDYTDKNQLKQREQTALLLSKLTDAGAGEPSVAGDA